MADSCPCWVTRLAGPALLLGAAIAAGFYGGRQSRSESVPGTAASSNDLLAGLTRPHNYRNRRVSSYDRSGGNVDWISLGPGKKATLAEIAGAGTVTHIWCTVLAQDPNYPCALILRAWWDGEAEPSVEAPLGDFFGVGHARVSSFHSLPLNMVTGAEVEKNNQAAMNCFFPMPFRKGARFEIENQSEKEVTAFYYSIDYEEHDSLPGDTLFFHAQYRQERPTEGYDTWFMNDKQMYADQANKSGDANYVLLEAAGRGHYVGCVLSINNLEDWDSHPWFGEGDDMIFVDGEKWPPSLHGTGTEDYFGAAFGFPSGKYDGLLQGISLAGNTTDWSGKWTMYRFHAESPVTFQKSIRVTMEHGHDNNRSDDWSSVAYWYQAEPHKKFPSLPPFAKRLP